MQAYVAADFTCPRCPWAPPPRLGGTDFLFARTYFCSCTRVPYMSVPSNGIIIGCWK